MTGRHQAGSLITMVLVFDSHFGHNGTMSTYSGKVGMLGMLGLIGDLMKVIRQKRMMMQHHQLQAADPHSWWWWWSFYVSVMLSIVCERACMSCTVVELLE